MTAEKVASFPAGHGLRRRASKYPFRAVAEDGGVWKLDPAEYDVKPFKIVRAAHQWARPNGYDATCLTHEGFVFVQFVKRDMNGSAS